MSIAPSSYTVRFMMSNVFSLIEPKFSSVPRFLRTAFSWFSARSSSAAMSMDSLPNAQTRSSPFRMA